MNLPLDGWSIADTGGLPWQPWVGSAGEARAKILGTADGYTVMLVEARPTRTSNRTDRRVHDLELVEERRVLLQRVVSIATDVTLDQ